MILILAVIGCLFLHMVAARTHFHIVQIRKPPKARGDPVVNLSDYNVDRFGAGEIAPDHDAVTSPQYPRTGLSSGATFASISLRGNHNPRVKQFQAPPTPQTEPSAIPF